MPTHSVCLLWISALAFSRWCSWAEAVIPSNALQLHEPRPTKNPQSSHKQEQTSTTIWASGASFGGDLPFGTRSGPPDHVTIEEDQLVIVEPPLSNPYLCDPIIAYDDASDSFVGRAMLVPRGKCSFERKALTAQQLGAELVAVRNTLESRYRLNDTSSTNATATYDDILWPQPKSDYECGNGRAFIPLNLLSFDPLPYDAEQNDPLLSGTAEEGNMCAIYATPGCLLYTSPSPRDKRQSRMPSSA